jgi:GLPGLI family protein
MSFKKYIILIFCFYITVNLFSQISYGKITYERKTNLYKKFKSNSDIKEWLNEEDKNKIDVFELYFNDTASVFKPEESDLVEKMSWATTKNSVYQNFNTKSRYTVKKIWGEQFNVTDTIRKFNWKITDSKRNICGYQCRKALWQVNDSTRIYAWFCLEINVSIGPESILGLPGAILGLATEDGGVIYFAKKVEIIQPDNTLFIPKKAKKTYKEKELITQLEKEFGKEKWGKAMIFNNFSIW